MTRKSRSTRSQVGDRLRVRPGDGVPVDGAVLEGSSAVDEVDGHGRVHAAAKAAGDKLIGGTVNGTGSLVMRADKIGSDTDAGAHRRHGGRGAAQPGADPAHGRHGGGLVRAGGARRRRRSPSSPGRSGGRRPSLAYALIAAVSVVIIACPCALGLGDADVDQVGVGKGAGAGVLIKSAEALERMEKVDTLVVDKTGTLTEGKPTVTAIVVRRRA